MEILKTIYTVILWLNFPLAAASFFFAAVLLFFAYKSKSYRERMDPIYLYFGLSVLFLGLWVIQWISTYYISPTKYLAWHISISYVLGLWILHFFTLFTHYYPLPYKISVAKLGVYYLVTIGYTLVFLLFPGIIVQEANVVFPYIFETLNLGGLLAYVIYFVYLSSISFLNLYHHYRTIGGDHSRKIRKIVGGSFFAIIVNLFFSIFFIYFTGVDTTPIGVLSTFAVQVYIYLILFGKAV